MSLSGNIEDVSVADALQFIHLGGRTGTLTLNCGEAKAGIGFHQGRIVNAWAPGGKRLGELLIEAGRLHALRIFDERNRGVGQRNGGPASAPPVAARPPVPATPATQGRSAPTPSNGVPLLPDEARTRLQVVSGDREIADRLAQALPEITVARVSLRDAGTPPPGEPPPLVLLDMRQGGLALDSVSALRRAPAPGPRPAPVDPRRPQGNGYQAGTAG